MGRQMLQVLEVNKQSRHWTVLIQVVERGNVHVARTTPFKRFRRFLLTDSQGTRVSALVYDSCIKLFQHMLCPFKRYYISNASIMDTSANFRIGNYPFSWAINSDTLIEPYNETTPPTLPCPFELTPFADLHQYADTEILQNVKAIAIHAFPPKQQKDSTTRDLVIVNEEKKMMLLTLWNEFAKDDGSKIASNIASAPMIIAIRIKVTTFNSLSLTSRLSSCILYNPPVPEDMQMNEWYAAHKQELKNMLEANAFKDTSLLLPPPGLEFIKDIKTVLASFDKRKTAWVQAKPAFILGQQKCWHTVCANCHKNVDADIDWIITCPSCNESTSIQMRCHIGIKLADETGKINCTIYSPEVEKLIPYTAIQLRDAYETGVALDMQPAESISKHTVVCFVRSFEVEYQSQQQKKNTVVKLYTLEELPQMITSINHENPPNVQTQLMTPAITEVKARASEDMITPLPAPTIEDKAAINTSATAPAPAKSSAKRSLNFTSKAANSISSVVDEASMLIEEDDSKQQSSITFEPETSRYK